MASISQNYRIPNVKLGGAEVSSTASKITGSGSKSTESPRNIFKAARSIAERKMLFLANINGHGDYDMGLKAFSCN